MNVQKVNVLGLKFLEGFVDRKVQTLLVIAGIVDGFSSAKFITTVGSGVPGIKARQEEQKPKSRSTPPGIG